VELFKMPLEEACLIALVQRNPGLLTFRTSAHGATPDFQRELALHCRDLQELELHRGDVTETSVYFLLTQCAHMTSLTLTSCYWYTAGTKADPFLHLQMRTLCLDGVDIMDDDLDALLRTCPNLTRLELKHCTELLGLDSLPLGTRCPSLTHLSLEENSSSLSDEMVMDISQHCQQLRALEIV
jgi:hypothetical protein